MSYRQLNSSALSSADLASVLTQAGAERMTVAAVESDLAAGCPVNGDGTINLIHYTAWLVSRSNE